MKRRGFLSNILAMGMAPAVVGSSILMPVKAIALPTQRFNWSGLPDSVLAGSYETELDTLIRDSYSRMTNQAVEQLLECARQLELYKRTGSFHRSAPV